MQNQRAKFSLPTGTTYLNCAYMSPLLKSVERAGINGIRQKRDPYSVTPTDFFTNVNLLRAEFAKLINVPDANRIAVAASASYGLATVAKNVRLSAGDKIVVASEQFPSNYYPWQRLSIDTRATVEAVAPPAYPEGRGKQWNERLLNAIDSKTKLVALGHVHWADGTRFNLEAIRKRTREVNALLVIDGTQSVGALPFDVQKIQPDALVCGGYKWLMGPYGMALAYFGEYFNNGVPLEENWISRKNSEDFTGLVNYQTDYQPGALRYDVGERSNFILVPMMLAALKQINQWKPENIQAYCRSISARAIDTLRENDYWIEDENFRGHHLLGVRFPKGTTMDVIREKVKKKKIAVSFRGDSMRVAPNVYNTAKDFEKLLNALI